MKVAIYARVSKREGQEPENQLAQLRQRCRDNDWDAVEYVDRQSAKTGERDAFQRLFQDAASNKFNMVLFWSLDRFTREGTLATLTYLRRLESAGVGWKSHTEEYLDSAGMFKDVILALLSTLAKQERLRISERTKAGLERARRAGKQLGRRPKIMDRDKMRRMRGEGKSLGEIAKVFGVSRTQVLRITKT